METLHDLSRRPVTTLELHGWGELTVQEVRPASGDSAVEVVARTSAGSSALSTGALYDATMRYEKARVEGTAVVDVAMRSPGGTGSVHLTLRPRLVSSQVEKAES